MISIKWGTGVYVGRSNVCEGGTGGTHVYTTGREGHGRSFSNYLLTLERTGAFLSIRVVIIWEGGKKEGVKGGGVGKARARVGVGVEVNKKNSQHHL